METPLEDKSVPCYSAALRLLSGREYSSHKMKMSLLRKGFERDTIDRVIALLIDRNYLRENVYIRYKIRTLVAKGFAPRYVVSKLQDEKLSVDVDTVGELMKEMEVTQEGQVKSLIEKKMATLTPSTKGLREKVLRYLLSKGHDYSFVASEVARQIGMDGD